GRSGRVKATGSSFAGCGPTSVYTRTGSTRTKSADDDAIPRLREEVRRLLRHLAATGRELPHALDLDGRDQESADRRAARHLVADEQFVRREAQAFLDGADPERFQRALRQDPGGDVVRLVLLRRHAEQVAVVEEPEG